MNSALEKIKRLRIYLLNQLEGLDDEQLNAIPKNHNNSIIWNLAHVISAQQTMCYVRANLPTTVDDKFITPYASGTKPDKPVSGNDVKQIKELLVTSIDQLQIDLAKNRFTSYTPSVMIPKVYGFEVRTIDEAVEYLLYHEGLHAGYLLRMKKELTL